MGVAPSGLRSATSLFTVLPVRSFTTVDRHVAQRAIAWLPAVGAVLGCLAVLTAGITWIGSHSALLAAIVAVLSLAALTGGLHLDGLADTADGLGSRKAPSAALDVMRRSDIGPMGVISIVGILGLDIASLASLGDRPAHVALAILMGPIVARASLWWATRPSFPPARQEGFGALFSGVTSLGAAWARTLALLILLGVIGSVVLRWNTASFGWPTWLNLISPVVQVLGPAILALLVASVWSRHLVRRLGGLSGDTFGSIVEVTQALTWFGLALTLAPR